MYQSCLNPIAHGPFIPCVPLRGAEFALPSKIILRKLYLGFHTYVMATYYQVPWIPRSMQSSQAYVDLTKDISLAWGDHP